MNTTAGALRARWAAGKPTFGVWVALACPFAVELLATPGVDYVCVDQQHGIVDGRDVVGLMRAAEGRGAVPITRVPANRPWLIGKALDVGAQGVVVPLVSSPGEAAAAVAACRYPPAGVRSFGPIRSSITMDARDPRTLGDEVLCFVMVETREGVEQVERIAATPGLDGIYVGPADLALGLGLAPDLDKAEPEHEAAVERILHACRAAGIVAGIQCGSGRSARRYADMGFQLVTFAKDSSVLQAAMRRELEAALGEARPAAAGRDGYT
ncbi:MAG TPA: aldolase/citrate lyase family protein [Candidatus Dormibacteraeota bacterium]|nr:aldolase/citrate lyase family protein [Candidatus Dormibacteraeota bacterium]